MAPAPICRTTLLLSLIIIVACRADSAPPPLGPDFSASTQPLTARTWTEAVNLGPIVNSPFTDIAAALSPDELSLYFVSTRPGGVGAGNDIWVAHRASRHSPWEAPVNLGAAVNSAGDDNGPSLSADGLMLFFNSNRPGGLGLADLYVSRRTDPTDDFGWGPPVNLGPGVNTADGERGPDFVEGVGNEPAALYFNRGNLGLGRAELYAAPASPSGEILGPAEVVADVNAPDANDAGQSLNANGQEIYFWSNRVGGVGGADLWASTRPGAHHSWSEAVNLGSPVNTEFAEERPFITRDGRELYFDSTRPEGIGGSQDIWVSTRVGDDGLRFSDWSAPVNLGPLVNSTAGDLEVSVSKDGLSLYIASSRSGNFDLWVSQRAGIDDAWGSPANLGPTINTAAREQAPFLSLDGHELYFFSDRPGGLGGTDLYVSHRQDKHDDFGWETPVNLGSGVNTSANETVAVLFEGDAAAPILYFTSNVAGSPDVYASTLQDDATFGPAAPIAEVNSTRRDAVIAIRRDGLELFLASDRPGPAAAPFDLFVATRANTSDAWSTPVNLGPVVNSAADDSRAALSFDGTTLYMESNRPGGLGDHDLWVTTRTKLKGPN